jgi:hypothetical protein
MRMKSEKEVRSVGPTKRENTALSYRREAKKIEGSEYGYGYGDRLIHKTVMSGFIVIYLVYCKLIFAVVEVYC